jgi:hypothetical protein
VRDLGFPVADRPVTEHNAADREHLRKIAQAEFVAQPPEHDESDDVGRILDGVQQALTSFVELLATCATAKGRPCSVKASAADYQQTVLQAFGQVAKILHALTHDTDLLAAQRGAHDTALASVGLQRINYGSGGIGILNLPDAQHQYQQALLGSVQADAQRYEDTV